MQTERKVSEIVIDLIKISAKQLSDKLDKVIYNQRYIKADTTEIGRMLQEFYKSSNKTEYYKGQFVIKNMSDSQAKDLLTRQGVSPQVVAALSDNKFTVQYLINLMKK